MYYEMREIQMEYQQQVEHIRKQYHHELSSHAFVSLYLWQKNMDLSLFLQEDYFTVKCGIAGENAWFFPCGKEQSIYQFIEEQMKRPSFSLCYLREKDVKWLQEKFPNKWKCMRVHSSDEYICDISEYIALNGSKFSDIRRNIRKIDTQYSVSVKQITEETLEDAKNVITEWATMPHHMGEKGLTDDEVALTALINRKELKITGCVVYFDQTPVSVFAGFPLTNDTVDVLIGKCIKNVPRGTVYYALREYLKLQADTFIYCNHEEDLGISGIRAVKTSLCPIRKNEIWEAVQT